MEVGRGFWCGIGGEIKVRGGGVVVERERPLTGSEREGELKDDEGSGWEGKMRDLLTGFFIYF